MQFPGDALEQAAEELLDDIFDETATSRELQVLQSELESETATCVGDEEREALSSALQHYDTSTSTSVSSPSPSPSSSEMSSSDTLRRSLSDAAHTPLAPPLPPKKPVLRRSQSTGVVRTSADDSVRNSRRKEQMQHSDSAEAVRDIDLSLSEGAVSAPVSTSSSNRSSGRERPPPLPPKQTSPPLASRHAHSQQQQSPPPPLSPQPAHATDDSQTEALRFLNSLVEMSYNEQRMHEQLAMAPGVSAAQERVLRKLWPNDAPQKAAALCDGGWASFQLAARSLTGFDRHDFIPAVLRVLSVEKLLECVGLAIHEHVHDMCKTELGFFGATKDPEASLHVCIVDEFLSMSCSAFLQDCVQKALAKSNGTAASLSTCVQQQLFSTVTLPDELLFCVQQVQHVQSLTSAKMWRALAGLVFGTFLACGVRRFRSENSSEDTTRLSQGCADLLVQFAAEVTPKKMSGKVARSLGRYSSLFKGRGGTERRSSLSTSLPSIAIPQRPPLSPTSTRLPSPSTSGGLTHAHVSPSSRSSQGSVGLSPSARSSQGNVTLSPSSRSSQGQVAVLKEPESLSQFLSGCNLLDKAELFEERKITLLSLKNSVKEDLFSMGIPKSIMAVVHQHLVQNVPSSAASMEFAKPLEELEDGFVKRPVLPELPEFSPSVVHSKAYKNFMRLKFEVTQRGGTPTSPKRQAAKPETPKASAEETLEDTNEDNLIY